MPKVYDTNISLVSQIILSYPFIPNHFISFIIINRDGIKDRGGNQ
jgi:hypothetical protein